MYENNRLTCSCRASFHHRSRRMHLLAAERSSPTPPVFSEEIMTLISELSRNLSMLLSREIGGIFPVNLVCVVSDLVSVGD
jgi:hypothetical protein